MNRAPALPDWPAALNQRLAAEYCGISVDTFTHACPVLPIVITRSRTGRRYLRVRLDEWLISLEHPNPKSSSGMGKMLDDARDTERA